jgi:hypothetical protein
MTTIKYTNDNGEQITWTKFQEELKNETLCGACGQYYEENQQGEDGYHSADLCDANDEIQEMKFTYTLTASFTTERELSEEELGALVLQVAPQIEEPVDGEGDSVDYEIKLITCEIGSLVIKEVK